MARTGMVDLIAQVRRLTNAGTAEYAVDANSYWSDDQIQSLLDANSRFFSNELVQWTPQNISGMSTYLYGYTPYGYLEGTASGTARLVVRDGDGEVVASGYTINEEKGEIIFDSDQNGNSYYITGYTYNPYSAAADLWLERLAQFSLWYQFSADTRSYSRQQAFEHAEKMEKLMRQRAAKGDVVNTSGGDVKLTPWVRIDVNG